MARRNRLILNVVLSFFLFPFWPIWLVIRHVTK